MRDRHGCDPMGQVVALTLFALLFAAPSPEDQIGTVVALTLADGFLMIVALILCRIQE